MCYEQHIFPLNLSILTAVLYVLHTIRIIGFKYRRRGSNPQPSG